VITIEVVFILAVNTNFFASCVPEPPIFSCIIKITVLSAMVSWKWSYIVRYTFIISGIEIVTIVASITDTIVSKAFAVWINIWRSNNSACISWGVTAFTCNRWTVGWITAETVTINWTPSFTKITNLSAHSCIKVFIVTIWAFYALSIWVKFVTVIVVPLNVSSWSFEYCYG